MRHQRNRHKLGRSPSHRKALLMNLSREVFDHERIQTTEAKAKELRRIAEPVITWGTKVADIIDKDPDKLDAEEKAAIVHAYRMARRVLKQRDALDKLFRELGPRFRGRPGGYIRVLKYRIRPGDAAPMSIVELIPGDAPAQPKAAKDDDGGGKGTKKAKGAKAKGESAEAKPEKAAKPKKKKASDEASAE